MVEPVDHSSISHKDQTESAGSDFSGFARRIWEGCSIDLSHDSDGSVRFGSVPSEPVPVLPVSVRAVSTRFRVLNTFLKNQKNPFQDDHSKFEFLECCLKYADDPPGGAGFAPPPLGDPCILSQPRNSNFE